MNDIKVTMTDCVRISVEGTSEKGVFRQRIRYVDGYQSDMYVIIKEMTKEIKEEIENEN